MARSTHLQRWDSNTVIQNLVNGETFHGVQLPSGGSELIGSLGGASKRGLEDEDGRSGKKGQFEISE